MRSIFFVLAILIYIQQSNAQNRYVNWYFAYNAGIKFNSAGPVNLTDGKTQNKYRTATMSDPCGNLLFYADNMEIWNKKHILMTNGNGLGGEQFSLSGVLIVPLPLSDSLYYVFKVSPLNGIYYSIVDMSRQGGDGEVITKNILLNTKCYEKLAAVLHSNKKDYWIVTHDEKNSEYTVYLLNENGIDPNPVKSLINKEDGRGNLRPSPDGSMLASSFLFLNKVEIYNFDNSKGWISLKTTLNNFSNKSPYDLEFSPDSKILYVNENNISGTRDLYQFDLTASNIAGSRYTIVSSDDMMGNFCPGPDGKLYIARENQNYLGVITNPNTFGSGVNYIPNGFYLGSQKSQLGLPNVIHPIVGINPEYAISAISGCTLSEPVRFEVLGNFCFDSLVWDLSDVTSPDNHSRKRKLNHIYPYRGNYDVTLTVYKNGKVYTYNKNLKVPNNPIVDLGRDTVLCGSAGYFLDAANPGASYHWNDGNKSKIRNITKSGKYWVTVALGKCISSDTITIRNDSILTLGNDTTDCFKSNLMYSNLKADSIIWGDGMNSKTRNFVAPTGIYYAKVFKGGCVKKDTIMIFLPELFYFRIPKDTTLCEGQTIVVNAPDKASIKYLWNDGSSTGAKTITKAGFYELKQWGGNCGYNFNFNLKVAQKFKLPEFSDTTICFGDKFRFATNLKGAELKINGLIKKGDNHLFDSIAYYFLKAENECFKDSAAFNLFMDSCPKVELIFPDIFSPNGDILNDQFKPVILGDPSKVFNYNFHIYNRWGERIFFTEKPTIGWDGNYSDKQCLLGYYVWTCNYKITRFEEVKSEQVRGWVFLIR